VAGGSGESLLLLEGGLIRVRERVPLFDKTPPGFGEVESWRGRGGAPI
jgi:hypothetical protein